MTFTLTDGRQVDSTGIYFDANTYHFWLGSEDITNKVKRADKISNWAKFDATVDNERLYAEKYVRENGKQPPPVGSTSTFKLFVNQITTDPLSAPLEALDKGFKQISGNSTFRVIAVVAVGVGIIYALSTVAKLKGAV